MPTPGMPPVEFGDRADFARKGPAAFGLPDKSKGKKDVKAGRKGLPAFLQKKLGKK